MTATEIKLSILNDTEIMNSPSPRNTYMYNDTKTEKKALSDLEPELDMYDNVTCYKQIWLVFRLR